MFSSNLKLGLEAKIFKNHQISKLSKNTLFQCKTSCSRESRIVQTRENDQSGAESKVSIGSLGLDTKI